jgi:hypothetical protein
MPLFTDVDHQISSISSSPPSQAPLFATETFSLILSFLDKPSLASCLRVSKAFFHLAGPKLYRDIEIVDNALESIAKGYDVVTRGRASRRGPTITNTKSQLLNCVRKITLRDHIDCDTASSDLVKSLPKHLDTLRVVPISIADNVPEVAHYCDLSNEHCRLRANLLKRGRSIDKIVYYVVGGVDASPTYTVAAKCAVRTITLVFESRMSSHSLQIVTSILATHTDANSLRLVFCPRSPFTRAVIEAQRYLMPYEPLKTKTFASFMANVYNMWSRPIDVYVIDGYEVCGRPGPNGFRDIQDAGKRCVGLQKRVIEPYNELRRNTDSGRIDIQLKTRADYLKSGITDEIDKDALTAWRAESVKAARASRLARKRGKETELAIIKERFIAEEDDMWKVAGEYASCMGEAYRMISQTDAIENRQVPPQSAAGSLSMTDTRMELREGGSLEASETDGASVRWDSALLAMMNDWEIERATRLYMESEEVFLSMKAEEVKGEVAGTDAAGHVLG